MAFVVVVLIMVVIGMAGSGSNKPTKAQAAFGSPELSNQIETISTPPSIEPLSSKSAAKGLAHLRLVIAAEGLSGAMIYSQNCYDEVSREFSWAGLDRCGAFDLIAVRHADAEDLAGLEAEAAYFDPEAAATRYLTAVTKGGETPDNADLRLEKLKQRAAAAKAPPLSIKLPEASADAAGEENEIPSEPANL